MSQSSTNSLAMHVFGLLAECATLPEMDEAVDSATVLFSSPCTGAIVTKHFKNLQQLMLKKGISDIDKAVVKEEDYTVMLKICF